MLHPLDGAKAKVARAKDQVEDLNGKILAVTNNSGSVIIQTDGEETIFRSNIPKHAALQWSVLIGEIAHNCRSALDHIMWQLSGEQGGVRTEFPIFTSKAEFVSSGLKKIKFVPHDAQAVIEELQPYNSGPKWSDSPLQQLHDLNRFDKHRKLQFVGVRLGAMSISIGGRGHLEHFSFTRAPAEAFPLEHGAEMCRTRTSGNRGIQIQNNFSFAIAFGESEVCKNQHIVPAMSQLCNYTEQVIKRFIPFFP